MDEVTKCLIAIVAILLMTTYVAVMVARAEIKERKELKKLMEEQSLELSITQQEVSSLQEVINKRDKKIAEKRRKILAENRKKRQAKIASVGVVEDDSSKQKSKPNSRQA